MKHDPATYLYVLRTRRPRVIAAFALWLAFTGLCLTTAVFIPGWPLWAAGVGATMVGRHALQYIRLAKELADLET